MQRVDFQYWPNYNKMFVLCEKKNVSKLVLKNNINISKTSIYKLTMELTHLKGKTSLTRKYGMDETPTEMQNCMITNIINAK